MRWWQMTEQFAYLKGYHYALAVIMRRWQLTEHVSYLRNQNHALLTFLMRRWQLTEHVLYLRVCITMLWPLSWDDGNWRAWVYLWGYHHALTVVMRRWQLTENVSYLQDPKPCSVRCHGMMTTDRARLISDGDGIMLWPLSRDDDNWQSMFHTWIIYNHALTVVMRRLQLKEHVSNLRNTLPCSDRCYGTMTTDRALCIP